MPIVALDNLIKSYRQTPALRGTSFDVEPGKISACSVLMAPALKDGPFSARG